MEKSILEASDEPIENYVTADKLDWQMYQLLFSPQAKFEYLSANLKGKISRRINKQHRLVYEILKMKRS